jgi:hypothetical protein
MNISINELQKMWREDSRMDPDNLHLESLKVPELHAKYHEMLYNTMLLKSKAEEDKKQLYKKRRDYYSGKCEDPDELANVVYEKRELPMVIEADKSFSELTLKIEYFNTLINYLSDIIKMIHGRTFQIKNAIDYQKFTAGF